MSGFLSVILLSMTVLLRFSPDTEFARTIRRMFVEKPCRWMMARSRRELIQAAVLAGLFLFAGELVMMLGSAELVFAYALDLSLYIDAMVAAALLGAADMVRKVPFAVRLRRPARRPKPRSRARRSRPISGRQAANDDDGPVRRAA